MDCYNFQFVSTLTIDVTGFNNGCGKETGEAIINLNFVDISLELR